MSAYDGEKVGGVLYRSGSKTSVTCTNSYVQSVKLSVGGTLVKRVRLVSTNDHGVTYKIDGSIDIDATPANVPSNLISILAETTIAAGGTSAVTDETKPLTLLVVSIKNTTSNKNATVDIEVFCE